MALDIGLAWKVGSCCIIVLSNNQPLHKDSAQWSCLINIQKVNTRLQIFFEQILSFSAQVESRGHDRTRRNKGTDVVSRKDTGRVVTDGTQRSILSNVTACARDRTQNKRKMTYIYMKLNQFCCKFAYPRNELGSWNQNTAPKFNFLLHR
jgi:hypothetical protein